MPVVQVAHFLEADEHPWVAALAAALFAPFSQATPTVNPQPPQERHDSSATPVAVAAEPPQLEPSVPGSRAVRFSLKNASSSKGKTRGVCSQAAARRQTWRHLDELAPLGDAADAVLRAWRLPLREQLPLTPAKWQPAVISSHSADGWLTLDCAEAAACCNAMRGVRGVHSLALDLRPDLPYASKVEYAPMHTTAAYKGARRAIAVLPALRALKLNAGGMNRLGPLLRRLPQLVHLQLSCTIHMATLAAPLGRLTAMTRLELTHVRVWGKDFDVPALLQVVGLMPRLAHLGLCSTGVSASDAGTLALLLGRLTALSFLNLRDNGITDGGMHALAPALSHLPRLAHLDLSNNDIDVTGAAALAPVLSRLTRLAHLGIGGFKIGDDGDAQLNALAQPLGLLTALTALDLDNSYIGSSEALAAALTCLSRLADLRLSETWACGSVLSSLGALTALTCLHFGHNNLGFEPDALALARALSRLSRLAHLELCSNYICPTGAALAPALGHLTALTAINLGGNTLGAEGAAALAPALSCLTALASLEVSHNYFGADGVAALAPALSRLTALKALEVSWNGIGADGVAALAPALSCLTALSRLGLEYNGIGAAGAAALAPALGLLSRLCHLLLDDNPVGDEGVSQLVPALARLPRLRSVSLREPHKISRRGRAALLRGLPTSVTVLFLLGCERRQLAEQRRMDRRVWLITVSVVCVWKLCTS